MLAFRRKQQSRCCIVISSCAVAVSSCDMISSRESHATSTSWWVLLFEPWPIDLHSSASKTSFAPMPIRRINGAICVGGRRKCLLLIFTMITHGSDAKGRHLDLTTSSMTHCPVIGPVSITCTCNNGCYSFSGLRNADEWSIMCRTDTDIQQYRLKPGTVLLSCPEDDRSPEMPRRDKRNRALTCKPEEGSYRQLVHWLLFCKIQKTFFVRLPDWLYSVVTASIALYLARSSLLIEPHIQVHVLGILASILSCK